MRKILVVEDDLLLREGLQIALEREGYVVASTDRGDQVLDVTRVQKPDLIVLDVMLPEMNGFEVCRLLRWKGIDVPIIMLSAEKQEEIDRVVGLETGADDYVLKPFGTRELLARIAACLRRFPSRGAVVTGYSFDDVEVDFEKRTIACAGRPVRLTATEFDLLQVLIKHRGQVLTREDLLNKVWGVGNYPTTRTVDMHVLALRQKLERNPHQPKHILSAHGKGYQFVS
jgi:two-component system alkaline phosphatase synthesis response regulator PhoP